MKSFKKQEELEKRRAKECLLNGLKQHVYPKRHDLTDIFHSPNVVLMVIDWRMPIDDPG